MLALTYIFTFLGILIPIPIFSQECAEVLSRLEAAAVREESRRLSEGRHSNGGRGGSLLSLRLPHPVPEPKLVDF